MISLSPSLQPDLRCERQRIARGDAAHGSTRFHITFVGTQSVDIAGTVQIDEPVQSTGPRDDGHGCFERTFRIRIEDYIKRQVWFVSNVPAMGERLMLKMLASFCTIRLSMMTADCSYFFIVNVRD